jgi:hypothetical protein
MRTTIIFVLILRSIFVLAQDENTYVPPAPNAAALLEYANIPVNQYSGIADISVPIFNFKSRKLNLPISISYHASGIKPQDNSSSVGLGWVLNAGGVITRLVRGLPDEDIEGYINTPVNDSKDPEPDLFFYNFNGKTGRFVFDKSRNTIQLPEKNIKIVIPSFTGTSSTWTIIDVDGISYTFGKDINSRETTSSTLKTPVKLKTYTSSWYLSEIRYPCDFDIITFNYASGGNVYFENYRQYTENLVDYSASCTPPGSWPPVANNAIVDIITQITINSPKYISSISSALASVYFDYANDRQDLANAFRLKGIRVNNGLEEVKKISLQNESYFVSDDCNTSDCKRLKLNSLVETTNGGYLPLKSFQYSAVNLPSRKTLKYDHWGFYNNNQESHSIPPSKSYQSVNGLKSWPGADKSPNFEKTKANILQRIDNPAGGYQAIVYEPNDYDDNGTIRVTGGVRVAQLIENDGTDINPQIVRNFLYRKFNNMAISSGVVYRKNYYDFLCSNQQYCSNNAGPYYYTFVKRFSTSLIDFYDLAGLHVGYSEVQIQFSNGSKELISFTNFTDRPDDPAQFAQGNSSSPDWTDPDGPPFIPRGDRSFERGLVKEHLYLSSTGKKLKRILNTYDYYIASSFQSTGFRSMLLNVDGNNYYQRKGTYTLQNRGARLIGSDEEVYDQLDDSRYLTNRITYVYNSQFSTLLSSISKYFSDNTEIKTEYTYACDYSIAPTTYWDGDSYGIISLKAKNMISIPLEIITSMKKSNWPGFRVLDSRLKTFWPDFNNNNYNVINPRAEFRLGVSSSLSDFVKSSVSASANFSTFNKDGRYKLVKQYDSYDLNGNLLQETPLDGIVSGYQWGFNNTVVTSHTSNPGPFQQVSSFDHKPLVGIKSLVDPSGRATYYDFDLFNRLKLIKDHDGNIVSRYRYNYKYVLENTPSFSYSTNQNNSIDFVSTSTLEAGTTLTWDFGNGIVKENALSTENQVYSAPGAYLVKLAASNPEYATTAITKTIQILPPVNIQISSPVVSSTRTYCPSTDIPTTVCQATVVGGPYVYSWEYNYSGSGSPSWLPVGTNSSSLSFVFGGAQASSSTIRCKISDSQGNQRYSNNVTIFYYCSGQPGPGDCPPGWGWNSQLGACEPPQGTCGEGCYWNGIKCVCP